MAFDVLRVTLVGNLTDDPVLRGEGDAKRATFRVAVNKGKDDKKKSLYFNVTAFNGRFDPLADNVVASLRKGMRVMVDGELDQYDIENAVINGETKNITVTSIRAYSVAPELSKATADVTRNPRDDQQGGQWQPQQSNAQAAAPQAAPAPQGQPQYATAPAGDVF